MIDPRGGAFTLGLGLVSGLALVTQAETWSPERLHRTRELADTPLVTLASGTALVRDGDGTWERVGVLEVHGDLPCKLGSALLGDRDRVDGDRTGRGLAVGAATGEGEDRS